VKGGISLLHALPRRNRFLKNKKKKTLSLYPILHFLFLFTILPPSSPSLTTTNLYVRVNVLYLLDDILIFCMKREDGGIESRVERGGRYHGS
jgi:hypothetical protein